MEISDEDRAVLADVVVDPDAWVAHALTIPNGELAVWAKVLKYRPAYLAKKDLPGYKTRAERDEEEL
uniref:Uncharacterized protein n=1 Tax=viral metagenome TaxID=1070528 RepID=A0A6M3ILS9_9ZZZZ